MINTTNGFHHQSQKYLGRETGNQAAVEDINKQAII